MKCSPHFSSSISGQDCLRHCQTFSLVSVSSALADSNVQTPLVSFADRLQVCESMPWPAPPGLGCLGSVEEDRQTESKINLALVDHLLTRHVQDIAEGKEHGFVQRNESLIPAFNSEIEVQPLPLAAEVEHGFARDSPLWIWECHGQIEVWPSPCAAFGECREPVAISPDVPATPVPSLQCPQFQSSLPLGPVAPSCTMPAPFSSVPAAAASQPGMSVAANSMERVSSHTRICNNHCSNRSSQTAPALQQGFATGSHALKKARAMLPAVDPKLLQLSRRTAK
eukprot:TRINITY_DN308_c0_g1_i1.p1 TRINITY_DN308_c0_g1~~TRINITY_DN308_c0_g1_i1.p1  ORF type:complete len:282 (-),score=36.43 TRINITY_DN308_c0_g1_i1:30-875(-)